MENKSQKDQKKYERIELLKKKIPITTSNIPIDKNSFVMFLCFSWGVIITALVSYWYFELLFTQPTLILYLALPINLYGNIWLFTFSSAVFSMIVVRFLRLIHPIKEGCFNLNTKEGKKEFKYYKLRFWFSYYALWLARAIPLPWVDFVVMKMMGSKIGKNVCLYDSWMDPELIEIGDFVMTSINTAILSHVVYDNYFIQLRVIIEKNAITGAQSIVAPGTYIEEGAILGAACSTYIGQRLKGNLIHVGNPASKSFPIKFGDKRG
ncbi:MAG: acyltransferase [Promethearchaeota archaeon]